MYVLKNYLGFFFFLNSHNSFLLRLNVFWSKLLFD